MHKLLPLRRVSFGHFNSSVSNCTSHIELTDFVASEESVQPSKRMHPEKTEIKSVNMRNCICMQIIVGIRDPFELSRAVTTITTFIQTMGNAADQLIFTLFRKCDLLAHFWANDD